MRSLTLPIAALALLAAPLGERAALARAYDSSGVHKVEVVTRPAQCHPFKHPTAHAQCKPPHPRRG